MSDAPDRNDDTRPVAEHGASSASGYRRPYEPPRIEESGSFERLVLACGHTPAGQPGGGSTCDPLKGGSTNS